MSLIGTTMTMTEYDVNPFADAISASTQSSAAPRHLSQNRNHAAAVSRSRSRNPNGHRHSRGSQRQLGIAGNVTITGDGFRGKSDAATMNVHVESDTPFDFDRSADCFGDGHQFQWKEADIYHLVVKLAEPRIKKAAFLEMLGITSGTIRVTKLKGKNNICELYLEKRADGEDFSAINEPQMTRAQSRLCAAHDVLDDIQKAIDEGEEDYGHFAMSYDEDRTKQVLALHATSKAYFKMRVEWKAAKLALELKAISMAEFDKLVLHQYQVALNGELEQHFAELALNPHSRPQGRFVRVCRDSIGGAGKSTWAQNV